MKTKFSGVIRLAIVLLAVVGVQDLRAQTYTYNGAGTSSVFTTAGDWVDSSNTVQTVAPTSSGYILVFDNTGVPTAGASLTTGVTSATYGKLVDNATGNLTFAVTTGQTLTFKAADTSSTAAIDMSGTGGNLTFSMPTMATSYRLSTSSEAWNVSSGRTLTFMGGQITSTATTSSTAVTLTGAGNIVINSNIAATNVKWNISGANVTMGGANTYTSATTISSGKLNVTGSLAATPVTVSGGTLQGSGSIAGAVSVASGAVLQAGTDAVTTGTVLTLSGGLTMATGSTLEFVLGAGNTHTTLALNSASTNTLASGLTLTLLGTMAAGTYTDIITGLTSDPGTEGSWTITNAGETATFSYDLAGGGINLTLQSVPEPETVSLLTLGCGILLFGMRKRLRLAV